MVGVAPSYPAAPHDEKGRGVIRPIPERWKRRPRLRRGSNAWQYLTGARALPATLVDDATTQDASREGSHGSAWFAHRLAGKVSHVEIRGPDYKGSLTGGRKTLFRYAPKQARPRRLAIAEAPVRHPLRRHM
jgi:Protein of unknown function (DUF3991)